MRSAVILAGGKASRMGNDKALVEFKGRPLLLWILDVLVDVVDELVISIAVDKKKEYMDIFEGRHKSQIDFLEDKYRFFGPLGGMMSAIPHLKGEFVAVAPCDSPFIAKELYPLLFDSASGYDGAVPKIKDHYEPLHSVYKKDSIVRAMELTMKRGELKPIDTYKHLNIYEVNEEKILKIDSDLKSFVNINTLEDLRLVEEL